jgi:NhaC family Na+:H+ antiporter
VKQLRQPNLIEAFLPLLALLITAGMSVFVWKANMFVPLIFSAIVAAIIGYYLGFKWSEMQEFLVKGVGYTVPVVLLLFIIGSIVGTWILSGAIPLLIYYGLAIISPMAFIPTAAITTGIMSIAIGSSFTSIATVGVALMAVGLGMGFPPGIVAGAIISGAFLGDKLSPLSDTTNMAPAMADTDLFSHVRHMMWDTIPAFALALILYWFIGIQYAANLVTQEGIAELMAMLDQTFNLSPILLILPAATIYIVYKKLPAIPSLILLSVLGGIFALILQGSSIGDIVKSMTNGFSGETGVKAVDKFLNRGGITSMFSTAAVVITAGALGGILEGTGMIHKIINSLIAKAKSTGSLVLTTILSTLAIGFASGSQSLCLVLGGRSFAPIYKQRGLDTKNLSRAIESAGTVGITLVPWGTPALFAAGVLGGLNPYEFIPFLFFAMIVPIVNIIYGYTGFTMAKKDYPDTGIAVQPISSSTSASM